jgi:hypothetical protein
MCADSRMEEFRKFSVAWPGRTRACRRRRTASARTSLPLSAAPDASRCDDFQCQALGAPLFRSSGCVCPRCLGRGGARKIRRLILRRSVGGRPPDGPPSGACRPRGSSILYQPHNAAEGDPTPGLRLCRCTWGTFSVGGGIHFLLWAEGVTGTSLAMAHRKPASSRAMATRTPLACCPRETSRRSRVQRRTWAFQRMSWMMLGCGASRRGRGRLTVAGSREAQAPATRARRAWGLPALVLDPYRRGAPEEYSEGSRPKHGIRSRG